MRTSSFAAWIVAPVLWTVLCLGLGLLLDRLSGRGTPKLLLVPLGFALLLVITTATVTWPPSARLTMSLAVVAAGAGFYVGRAELRRLAGALPVLVVAGVTYVLYLLPILVSGAPFAGWIKLDDGSTWLAFADRLLDAGRTAAGLPPSSYEAVLQINFAGSYPVGAFAPLGGMSALLGVDAAWLLQPYLAYCAAILAVGILHLLRFHVDGTVLRGSLAVIASTPALLLGYAWWGGIKELVLAGLFVLTALMAGRRAEPLVMAVAFAGVVCVAGFSGGPWLLLAFVVWALQALRQGGWRPVAVMLSAVIVMSLPVLVQVRWQDVTHLAGFAAGSSDIGVLWGPLDRLQILGIWPAGDFRARPDAMGPVLLLLVVVVFLAGLGLWAAVRGREWALPVYVGGVVPVALLSTLGNPWIGGKALAMASPAALAAAAAGIGWLWAQGRRIEGAVAVALIATGVGWSYWLAYQQVWLAPTDQLRELQAIGEDNALPKPALMLEYSPYGVRHFLRDLDAEGAGELRRRRIPTVDGGTVNKAEYADIDRISTQAQVDFPTLVLRRSVSASRPPANYRLRSAGEFYEIWEWDPAVQVLSHVPLGTTADPAGEPACRAVLDLAAAAGPGTSIAFVERPPVIMVPLGPDGSVDAGRSQRISVPFVVEDQGPYEAVLGGSFPGELRMLIDGQEIWSGRHQLNWTGNTTPVGVVDLAAGQHELSLEYEVGGLQPGTRAGNWALGPVYLSLSSADAPVQRIDPAQARELCGRRLDWLEVVRP